MIEIEKRGKLSGEPAKKFKDFLIHHALLIGKSEQLTIFIETENNYLGSINNLNASISIQLISNLITSKYLSTLKGKLGSFDLETRKEFNISFDYSHLNDLFSFLEIFHIFTGCPRYYYREDYKYKDFTISLKYDGLAPDHYEIEKLVPETCSKEVIIKSKDDISNFLSQFELNSYTPEEYKTIMLKVLDSNPPVELRSIDIDSYFTHS